MNFKGIVLATIVSAIVLFMWNGFSQMFPWGVPSSQVVSTQNNGKIEHFQAENIIQYGVNELTTTKFDEVFTNHISTLTTNGSFSWIISRPSEYYNVTNYFTREFITQLLVAFLLSLLLWQNRQLPNSRRLINVLFIGSLITASAYGAQMNWWGMPAVYALGIGFNTIVGFLLVALLITRFFIPSIAK